MSSNQKNLFAGYNQMTRPMMWAEIKNLRSQLDALRQEPMKMADRAENAAAAPILVLDPIEDAPEPMKDARPSNKMKKAIKKAAAKLHNDDATKDDEHKLISAACFALIMGRTDAGSNHWAGRIMKMVDSD